MLTWNSSGFFNLKGPELVAAVIAIVWLLLTLFLGDF